MRTPLVLAAVLLFGLAAPVSAQQPSYTLFGQTNGSSSLSAVGTPKLGSSFTLQVTGCVRSPFGFTSATPGLVWGVSVAEAVTALGMIGPAAKAAIPTLEELAEHEDRQIAERAEAALSQIRG